MVLQAKIAIAAGVALGAYFLVRRRAPGMLPQSLGGYAPLPKNADGVPPSNPTSTGDSVNQTSPSDTSQPPPSQSPDGKYTDPGFTNPLPDSGAGSSKPAPSSPATGDPSSMYLIENITPLVSMDMRTSGFVSRRQSAFATVRQSNRSLFLGE